MAATDKPLPDSRRDVVIGRFDEIRHEFGGVFEPVLGKSIPEPGEGARQEHDDEITELRRGRGQRDPRMISGWYFQ